jgi:hypothetical protein
VSKFACIFSPATGSGLECYGMTREERNQQKEIVVEEGLFSDRFHGRHRDFPISVVCVDGLGRFRLARGFMKEGVR